MAVYTFTNKHKDLSPEKIWKLIQDGLSKNIIIKSINKEIHYNINYITENEISFSADPEMPVILK